MTNLSNASLIGVNACNANARGIIADNSNWTGSDLRGAQFDGSSFKGACLDNVKIDANTSLKGCNMEGVSTKGMTFVGEDGSITPVTKTMLQEECKATGLGEAVALEKAAAQGHISTDAPAVAATKEHNPFADMAKFAVAEAPVENLGALGKPDAPDVRVAAGLTKDSPTSGVA